MMTDQAQQALKFLAELTAGISLPRDGHKRVEQALNTIGAALATRQPLASVPAPEKSS